MHMMSVVDLIGNAVHPSMIPEHQVRLLIDMMTVVDLKGDAVYQSVLSDVHDGICSTPAGKYSTPSEAPDAHDGCCRQDGECITPKCAS